MWLLPGDLTHTARAPVRAFDKLKEVRQLEYELDFAQNRAARDKAALKERLTASLAAGKKLQVQLAALQSSGRDSERQPLGNRENTLHVVGRNLQP